MSDNLRYEKISLGMKDLDKIEEIYCNSFPPEERFLTIKQALEMQNDEEPTENVAVYDGNNVIGFYSLSLNKDYKYLQFFAVDKNIRSKGYGGQIIKKLLEENKNTIFFASIEKPNPNEPNYELKMRRKQFYEKNGMITVDKEVSINGLKFIVVTNKISDKFDKCYENAMDTVKKQIDNISNTVSEINTKNDKKSIKNDTIKNT